VDPRGLLSLWTVLVVGVVVLIRLANGVAWIHLKQKILPACLMERKGYLILSSLVRDLCS